MAPFQIDLTAPPLPPGRPHLRAAYGADHAQGKAAHPPRRPLGRTVAAVTATDDAELTALGYRPSLERSVGRFGSFAAGVSYISVLTGTFQLFYFGFGSGGPAYWWS